MVEVIKKVDLIKRQIMCKCCKSVLEYTIKDEYFSSSYDPEEIGGYHGIICPNCGKGTQTRNMGEEF